MQNLDEEFKELWDWDYLIKSNTDEVVKAEQLEDKIKSLYSFVPLEVIFVPMHDYILYNTVLQQRFDEVFSTMPWPAIPYTDFKSWERLANSFVASPSGYLPVSVAISPTGKVLQSSVDPLIQAFGVDAYPFLDRTIQNLDLVDETIRDRPSLEPLLVSHGRDYVINNKGDKVNVNDLEDKVVALYLYEDGCTSHDLTTFLEMAYRENMDFEVVLVYIHHSPNTIGRTDLESFNKRFETMPWLALPFKDARCKKVLRVFEYPLELVREEPDHSLVIIGPHGRFVERLGASVLMKFGIEAYPFTREKAYAMQIEKVKNLKLKMLFGRKAVLTRYCYSTFQKVFFFKIDVKKTVIVFSEPDRDVCYWEFKMKLWQKYMERKGSSDEFEVIHIGGSAEEHVPWFKIASSSSWFDKLYKNATGIFSDTLRCEGGYGVLVFDSHGNVVRATKNPGIFDFDDRHFPFCADDGFEKEVIDELKHTCNWKLS